MPPAKPYDWDAEACPGCGADQWAVRCRCLAADRLCQRCHRWSHVDDTGTRVLGAWLHQVAGG